MSTAGPRTKPGEADEDAEKALVAQLRANRNTGAVAKARLTTDERVLARITDGIYRQPSSALRELISNAYDADATEVVIETDAPRFTKITVRDNGHGMTEQALSRLIYHIGGSSKRTTIGKDFGTTSADDANLSPKGRRLIGKIGIGLFSVSQLTAHFQVITKVRGTDYRLFADVVLNRYREDADDGAGDGTFETGSVEITHQPAADTSTQQTEIILLDLHPRARDILRSGEVWRRVDERQQEGAAAEDQDASPPTFHVGYLSKEPEAGDGPELFKFRHDPNLPWAAADGPREKFLKLCDQIAARAGDTTARPDLAKTLDSYLSTVWSLSLAAPVEYRGKHPFDLSTEDRVRYFRLTGYTGRAEEVSLKPGQTVREAMGLSEGAADPAGGFAAFIDGVQLLRPITFAYAASPTDQIRSPLMFVGSYAPDLSKIPSTMRGGDLSFEAYLFWNPRIVPKQNNGAMVRINNASGAPFDDTFLRYQVSEQTRLRQITSEIFVTEGLDAALNIDRESFNYGHPHLQLLTRWLHGSLRQLANTQKDLSQRIRDRQRDEKAKFRSSELERLAESTWDTFRKSGGSPPTVEIVASEAEAEKQRGSGALALNASQIPAVMASNARGQAGTQEQRHSQLKALAAVLDAFSLLEDMHYERQHQLMNAILSIFYDDAQG